LSTILIDVVVQVILYGVLVTIDLIALQSMASPSIMNTREHYNMIMLLWDHAMPKKRAKATVHNLPQLQVPHCTIQYELCITLSSFHPQCMQSMLPRIPPILIASIHGLWIKQWSNKKPYFEIRKIYQHDTLVLALSELTYAT
jgi:hypothetical protein